MKRLLIVSALLLLSASAFGWGGVGHRVAVALAQRHLTERTKANIAKYFDHDIIKDAVWMDTHRNDEPIAYTSHWHGCYVDADCEFDPNPSLSQGCVMNGLLTADHNLRHWRDLSDSAVVMNVRMLIHFVPDFHCPTHTHFNYRKPRYKCVLNGTKYSKFHSVYDKMPALIYAKQKPQEVALTLDVKSKKEIKKIVEGSFLDWIHTAALDSRIIYEINPWGTENLAEDTVERSKDLIDIQLQRAGYRLAYLLNKYFDN